MTASYLSAARNDNEVDEGDVASIPSNLTFTRAVSRIPSPGNAQEEEPAKQLELPKAADMPRARSSSEETTQIADTPCATQQPQIVDSSPSQDEGLNATYMEQRLRSIL